MIGGRGSDLEPLLTPRATRRAAWLVLHYLLEVKLNELTSLGLLLRYEPPETLLPRGHTDSLLGAAWLALVETAAGGLQARRCPRCARWFVADPSQERRNPRTYCRATCRVAMAEKRLRARELAAAGKKAPTIAKAVRQDVKTVREWLREKKTTRTKGGSK